MGDWEDQWEAAPEEGWVDTPKQEPGAGHGGLALPPPPSHGGYRGSVATTKPEFAVLPEGELTFADLKFTERRGQTNAAHKTERYAYIDTKRTADLIAGEERKGGVKFVHHGHTAKSESDRQGRGFLSRGSYACHHGPTNNNMSAQEVKECTLAVRAAADSAGKIARVGTKTRSNRSVKIGCKCSFKINVLAAYPEVAEVVASHFPHTAQCGVMRDGLSNGVLAGGALH